MFEALVPISVHCAIPFSECQGRTLSEMPKSPKIGEASDDVDQNLADNFAVLMGKRSVAALRQEMAEQGMTIGSGAIQAAKAGSRGLRLETLQKFAEFFNRSVYELIRPKDVNAGAWPFSRLTPSDFALASEEMKIEAEGLLMRSAERARLGESSDEQATDSRRRSTG